MASQLEEERDVQVEKVKGGFGEFSVWVDDQKVIDVHRLWYPSVKKVVNQVKTLLAEPSV
ncbi:MAG: hypothetical protein NZT92_11175 [Abditibacteriales bacterium]|nr:hypothetical protein [Abditibacteriales bacterium]